MNLELPSGMTRRTFLKLGAASAAGAALAVSGCGILSESRPAKIPIGLQLYSVRGECEKDLPGVIKAVGEMGYEGVEFAGYYGRSAEDLRKLLDESHLECCGTHIGLDTLLGDRLAETVAFNKTLRNPYLIVPGLPEERRNSIAAWTETAKIFNDIAAKLEGEGLRVGYHNHSAEFPPMEGQIPWDVFASNTRKDVILQFDMGNAKHGGGDALAYIEKYPGRSGTVHVKEYSATDPKALVGEGDLPWPALVAACKTVGGTEWFIIEYESDAYPPLESVRLCLENFRKFV